MTTLARIESNAETTLVLGSFTDRALTVSEKDIIAFHISHARSKNTRIAYENQWRQWVAFCAAQRDDSGQGFVPFPAATSTVILYLTHLAAQGHKISKIEQALSAIRAVHNDNINLLPAGSDISFTHPHIRAALNSIRRSLAAQGKMIVKKPRHFSQQEIKQMSLALLREGTAQAVADRALLLLLVNTGLRSSEAVALELEDITVEPGKGMNVRIRSSKTNQFGEEPEQIYVMALAPHLEAYDAMKSMVEWLRWRETYNTGKDVSVFIGFRKGGNSAHLNTDGFAHGLTREAVSTSLRRAADLAGLEPAAQSISSHSGRHTLVTRGFEMGLDSATLSKTSRHKSLKSLLSYDQSSHKAASLSVKLWQ